jgi:SAM-dependent methyltransferase
MLDQTNNRGEQQSPFSFVIQSRSSTKKSVGGDVLRGTIRRIEGRLVQLSSQKSGRRNIVTQVTFKYHGATDIAKNWSPSETVTNLSMILRGQADSTGNVLPKTEWDNCHNNKMQLLPSTMMIQSAEIEAGGKIYRWSNNGKAAPKFSILASSSPSSSANSSSTGPTTTTTSIPAHDRVRQTTLAADHPVWAAIGIANLQTGIVKPTMAAKYRQCQKFVEIVARLVPASPAASAAASSNSNDNDNYNNNNSQQRNITVVDMGCGRGYLTFALHAHLTEEKKNRRCVTTKGIDVRPKLVADMNTVARTLAMEGLSFQCGTIDDFLQQQQQQPPSPNYPDDTNASSSSIIRSKVGDDDDGDFSIVIALHACDTATDDALWYGITQRADALVVAPCCHKQVRPQLDLVVAKHSDHPYADILQHGIYRERLAETVTDTLRALLLELCGYQVQVFEFIGGEHTSKNVMITARKKPIPLPDEQKHNLTIRIQSLAQLHGIRHQSLADRMGLLLSAGGSTRSNKAQKQDRAIAINGMPALSKKDQAA